LIKSKGSETQKFKAGTQKKKAGLRERSYAFSIEVIKFLDDLPEKRAYRILSDPNITLRNQCWCKHR